MVEFLLDELGRDCYFKKDNGVMDATSILRQRQTFWKRKILSHFCNDSACYLVCQCDGSVLISKACSKVNLLYDDTTDGIERP